MVFDLLGNIFKYVLLKFSDSIIYIFFFKQFRNLSTWTTCCEVSRGMNLQCGLPITKYLLGAKESPHKKLTD